MLAEVEQGCGGARQGGAWGFSWVLGFCLSVNHMQPNFVSAHLYMPDRWLETGCAPPVAISWVGAVLRMTAVYLWNPGVKRVATCKLVVLRCVRHHMSCHHLAVAPSCSQMLLGSLF